MAGQIEDYRKEIFNFLRTVTIKFEPFAYSMGQSYMEQYGLDDPHGEWNPYYINLTGEYAPNDTRMTVYSLEENRDVPFDKDLVRNYPKTAAVYRVQNSEYTTLEERYPGNIGLIRTITYPVKDMATALAAPNFALLAYDETLLDYNEREDLIRCLKEFLEMVRIRWWIPEFDYEDMYAITFWGLMWQHLPLLLLARRMKNIRTPNVHTFHIWEYLKSRGLGDYRDVLTNNQSLWLYRNIDYIHKNQGKTSNLTILAENLLEEVFVSLLDKDMYQETGSHWDSDLRTNPVFVSHNYIDHDLEKTESFQILNNRLVDQGFEHRDDAEYVATTEAELGTHNYNILPTKYLEFKKDPVNTGNEKLMVNFFLDTLLYRYSYNDLSYQCQVVETINGERLTLYVGDMILLWHWALAHYCDNYSDKLPTLYKVHLPFRRETVTASDLPASIYYNSTEYALKSLVNVEDHLGRIDWHPRPFTTIDDFINTTADQFRDVLVLNRQAVLSNRLQFHLALNEFEKVVTATEYVTLSWGQYTTFTEWRKQDERLDAILALYEERNDPEDYFNLATACFDALFPLDDATLDEFLGSLRNMEKIYASIRDLFIKLCSYNVTYLETERDVHEYLPLDDPDFATFLTLQYHLGIIYLILEEFWFKARYSIDINLPDLVYDVNFSIGDLGYHLKREIPVEYPVKLNTVYRYQRPLRHDVDVARAQRVYRLHVPINVDDVVSVSRG